MTEDITITLEMIQVGSKAAEEANGLKIFAAVYKAMRAVDPTASPSTHQVLVDREDLRKVLDYCRWSYEQEKECPWPSWVEAKRRLEATLGSDNDG